MGNRAASAGRGGRDRRRPGAGRPRAGRRRIRSANAGRRSRRRPCALRRELQLLHGMDARGIRGVAPSLARSRRPGRRLRALDGPDADVHPAAEPVRPRRGSGAATATTWWRTSHPWATPGSPPDLANGSEAEAAAVHQSCAGCHSVVGAGGVITGASAPALQQASARQIAEAVRARPLCDAAFGEGQLSAATSPRSHVRAGDAQPRRPRRLGDRPHRSGSGGHGGVAAGGVALLLVPRLIGERTGERRCGVSSRLALARARPRRPRAGPDPASPSRPGACRAPAAERPLPVLGRGLLRSHSPCSSSLDRDTQLLGADRSAGARARPARSVVAGQAWSCRGRRAMERGPPWARPGGAAETDRGGWRRPRRGVRGGACSWARPASPAPRARRRARSAGIAGPASTGGIGRRPGGGHAAWSTSPASRSLPRRRASARSDRLPRGRRPRELGSPVVAAAAPAQRRSPARPAGWAPEGSSPTRRSARTRAARSRSTATRLRRHVAWAGAGLPLPLLDVRSARAAARRMFGPAGARCRSCRCAIDGDGELVAGGRLLRAGRPVLVERAPSVIERGVRGALAHERAGVARLVRRRSATCSPTTGRSCSARSRCTASSSSSPPAST